MACAGDVATIEALAAMAILRERFPDLKLRFVNVVDLFKLQPSSEHPHGLTDRDFDSLFTPDKPIIFNFHGYPWLIHKLAYAGQSRQSARARLQGIREHQHAASLAIENQTDRFDLAIDAINRVPRLQVTGAHQGLAEGPDLREPRLRGYQRHRQARDSQLEMAVLRIAD